jgi:hypothetical protein
MLRKLYLARNAKNIQKMEECKKVGRLQIVFKKN